MDETKKKRRKIREGEREDMLPPQERQGSYVLEESKERPDRKRSSAVERETVKKGRERVSCG